MPSAPGQRGAKTRAAEPPALGVCAQGDDNKEMKTRILAALCLTAALPCAPVHAQFCSHVPSNTPSNGRCNAFPFSVTSSRYQTIVTRQDLGQRVTGLRQLAFAACRNGTLSASRITVRFAYISGTQLSNNFAANLGTQSVVMLQKQNFRWNYVADQWTDLGLTGLFTYLPTRGNLLVDIEIAGVTGGSTFRSDTRARLYANDWASQPPATGTQSNGALKMRLSEGRACTPASFTSYGAGCGRGPLKIIGLGRPQLGAQVQIQLGQGVPSRAGAYFLGLKRSAIGLDAAGMTGCTLYTDLVDVAATAFNFAGQANPLSFTIPRDARLVGLKLMYSGLNIDTRSNRRGITTAGGLAMQVGF